MGYAGQRPVYGPGLLTNRWPGGFGLLDSDRPQEKDDQAVFGEQEYGTGTEIARLRSVGGCAFLYHTNPHPVRNVSPKGADPGVGVGKPQGLQQGRQPPPCNLVFHRDAAYSLAAC